jgi:hypothetical protein
MTELEWLKQESGLTDDEMKAMEAVAGHTKFVGMLQKMIATNEQSTSAKQAAEAERLALEKRYQEEFIPEMRKVTQDSLRAQGEAAAAQAALKAAREYGIVPEAEPVKQAEAVRAPGSPDPAAQQAEFQKWSQAQSRAIITLNDLNAEHFKLFGAPLPNSQELADEVQRQHTLGHRDYSLKAAWESKFNVPAKREEIAKAEQQKTIDAAVAAARKEDRQKAGSNPGLVSGQPSRFSTYKPSDANSSAEPWKAPAGMRKATNQPWREKAVQKLAAA